MNNIFFSSLFLNKENKKNAETITLIFQEASANAQQQDKQQSPRHINRRRAFVAIILVVLKILPIFLKG